MALWRNWIAHLTTNQEVTSSNLVRVTLSENWLKSTDSPFFVLLSFLDIKGIKENIEFTRVVRTFPFNLL